MSLRVLDRRTAVVFGLAGLPTLADRRRARSAIRDVNRRLAFVRSRRFGTAAAEMRKPRSRATLPPRRSDNRKRRLDSGLTAEEVQAQYGSASYKGSSKHKQNPHLFDLEPFRGVRGDRTLCDKHASFSPADMARVPALLERALRAGLVGSHMWTVDDNGWIYELSITNPTSSERHGYPVRASEAIAETVYRHFEAWALQSGSEGDRAAAEACRERYGFRP